MRGWEVEKSYIKTYWETDEDQDVMAFTSAKQARKQGKEIRAANSRCIDWLIPEHSLVGNWKVYIIPISSQMYWKGVVPVTGTNMRQIYIFDKNATQPK